MISMGSKTVKLERTVIWEKKFLKTTLWNVKVKLKLWNNC